MEKKANIELCHVEWAFNLRFDSYNFIHTVARQKYRRWNTFFSNVFAEIMCIHSLGVTGQSSLLGCVRGIPLSRVFLVGWIGVRRNVSTRWEVVINHFYRALNPAKEYEGWKEQPVFTYTSLWTHLSVHARILVCSMTQILRHLLLEIKLLPVLHTLRSYFR